MPNQLHSQIWHRSIAKLIEKLNRPEFWNSLVRLLNEYSPIDNWVVLMFDNEGVQAICYPDTADDGEIDGLLNRYVKGLYILDPFYIANRDNPQSGFFHLLDIAPTHFLETEYYHLYFEQFVSVDEVQYNVQLDSEKTLCLSMGSKSHFTQEHIFIFDLVKPWVLALIKQRIAFDTQEEKSSHPQQWQDKILEIAPQLTGREIDVLKLALSGFSNSEIAGKLSVSPETVKVHRRNFYGKLNIKSQSELFAYFFRSTLT
ncbi:LuxR family transcriptional regulator [Pseudomonas savastanoi pv. glycinea str. race 4]|uniref:LuxR family transcriptional regulator n=1 Tax=Pseudomonas savastanoi pv. glycinea str. race 4 TaxID=875330 RepID=F3CC97_PSESG|nr:LuxR family transcriptional regulator [Pseudomonas savastanoi pv. glycinea str. race 4]